jgi:hypothetical protein
VPLRKETIRRAFVAVFVFTAVWAVFVAIAGGFFWQIGSFRISSRDPWRPLMVAIAAGIGVVALTPRAQIRSEIHRTALPVAIAIAVGGIAIDVYQWSGGTTFWLDEEMIALNFRDRSVAELSGALWLEQSAPYGWLVIQRLVLLTLGDGERALRLMPLLFGIATVVAAVWVGRRWLGAIGMPGLVLLCWISPFLSHYRFEVKHYTADAFFGLVLPALVVWVIEGESVRMRVRRAAIWWAVAAIGQFLANGALLVTPGCALVLLIAIWRRDGWRATGAAAAGGMLFLAAVAGHYELSMRYTAHLRDYWADRFPPRAASATDLAQWFVSRLELLARNPAGTSRWLSLWLLAAAGFAFGGAGWFAAAFAIVPLSAFAYAIGGYVPLYERFTIWIVPALYIGVLLVAGRAVRARDAAWNSRRWIQIAITLLLPLPLVSDIVMRGYRDLDIPPLTEKQALIDRAAVRALLAQRRPGDAVITTRLGWPAIWWYGRISIADRNESEDRPDGFEMRYAEPGPDCRPPALIGMPPNTRRLLVYLGFPDVPDGFERVLRQSLDTVGATVGYHKFAGRGRLFVVDLERRSDSSVTEKTDGAAGDLRGCVALRPIRRW